VNIIFSNRKYMILEIEIMRVGAENVGPKALDMFDLSRPTLDWCQLANGMGVHAMRASSVDGVNQAMVHCMGNKGPHLIEVII
jgi:acetolactate synthase-1/2/3 large subunit